MEKKKGKKWIIVVVLLLIVAVICAFYYVKNNTKKIGTKSLSKSVSVSDTSETETESETVTETETETETTDMFNEIINVKNRPDSYSIDIEAVLQNPELPTGCEITSLTTVLNFWGYDVDKCTMADDFLEKGTGSDSRIDEVFIGSPYDSNAFGCYAPVIEKAANKYLKSVKSEMQAQVIPSCTTDKLYNCVSQGYPVVVWATMGLHEPNWVTYWTYDDGTVFEFPSYEHCMVLTGYDENAGTVEVCDPMKGNYTYDMEQFETVFKEMERQAVLVY